ncbi:MAG TPA: hypothetical protein ENJ60_00130 [Aeromonadales bacterium]|nr:hypothetical protein [Aeromonadales bacterium]
MILGIILGVDYLFIILYASTISLSCLLLARKISMVFPHAANLGIFIAKIQIIAALCDATENFALIQLLLGSDHPHWPVIALWMALIKFSLIGIGILYIIITSLTLLITSSK